MSGTKKRLHVHIPYRMLVEELPKVLDMGLNPEVFLDAETLDNIDLKEVREVSSALSDRGLFTTIHGPFMELSPGAPDGRVRMATVDRFNQTLDVAERLRPRAIVLHGGFDDRHFDGDVDVWLNESLKTWPEIAARAERLDTVIAVENIFEEEPTPLRRLIDSIASSAFGVCIDVGHLKLFSKVSLEEWFKTINNDIKELHIHDNHGTTDEHLAIGEGDIDFDLFFSLVTAHAEDPIYTIEPHGEEALKRALKAVQRYL